MKRRFFDAHTGDVQRAAQMIAKAFKAKGKLLVFGNGGSAADAQHIAGEMINKFLKDRRALPAIALTTDGGVLTCIANATSGKSLNVTLACEQARKQGVTVIGFLGRDGGSVAALCDLALIIPS